MTNSRAKGARGERSFSKLCRDHGWENARRGQQFSGLEGEDVVGLPKIHVECKWVQALQLDKAMEQSIRDAQDKIPIVAHKKNYKPVMITMLAEDWFKLYGEWYSSVYLEEVE